MSDALKRTFELALHDAGQLRALIYGYAQTLLHLSDQPHICAKRSFGIHAVMDQRPRGLGGLLKTDPQLRLEQQRFAQ